MTRIPTVSFEEYEEPMAVAADNAVRQSTKGATPPATPAADDKMKGAATPLRQSPTPGGSTQGNESDSSMKLGKMQRAEDYPQIAFRPLRELRHNGTEGEAHVRPRRSTSRARELVFGLGSHGLCDQSAVRHNAQEDRMEHAKNAAGYPAQPPCEGMATTFFLRRPKSASREGKKDSARTPPLPPIELPSTAVGQGTGTTTTAANASLRAPGPARKAARTLRCGGIIDTFSYFSVHRVYPELYAR
ncbi:hypothetical protein ABB37_06717 [Leptomonas pyrrhocoris]|uniref:Uncharacterized protein n=1 Tax=Leptomonas pyrrhocoris TaxID=157538 RepID=A0A0N0DTU4_LEPPY|nr:hypothetical protein ABB37_06710 [Leptomonas pyrrhocoris]XP_015656384.1 hypothetical protein ABB37_06717 [Leptomonas pyrrhocoris]KPA77934.1 hypothetical protein ABB37_06710 [Leptomonas pyrrhocoris]KPA77945.1 hypothetical protein ABB37_06717 [Leptomonas pyrrhocoris]|eukprot:XP_015656373.1 hypothetical protein ABB37_06710 [Leptomonas pyrrhocoris]